MKKSFLATHLNKLLPIGLALMAIAATSLFLFTPRSEQLRANLSTTEFPDQSVISASETSTPSVQTETKYKEGDYYIAPQIDTMHWADKQEFTSYIEMSTGPVAVESAWSVSNKQRAEFKNCEESKTCTVYTDMGNIQFDLIAKHENKSASMTIKPAYNTVNPFSDTLPDWADTEIVSLYNRGIITGYADGRYGAGDPVTRAQYVLLSQKTAEFVGVDLSQVTEDQNCDIFSDVSKDHYAYNAICIAHNLGWLNGIDFPENKFQPDLTLKRDLGAQITYNVILKGTIARVDNELKKTGITILDDIILDQIHEYTDLTEDMPYLEAMLSASYLGVMGESGSRKFNPEGDLNRAQAAAILWRAKYSMHELENFK